MPYIKSFPTSSNQLRRPTDWRDRREQSTPLKQDSGRPKEESRLDTTMQFSYEM